MNAATPMIPAADPSSANVDERNPWLGLASFTEETRAYFYGREEEVAELARRVQRKLLTVLFGQSGLGKTSILRAGLVPRLRAQGYCPIYVRIDYGHDAPEPADQIKQAISRTARHSGQWTQAGVAIEGESLWEFLHHRDDVLRDEAGNTLIPLLIFDQFEEIFTLAQSDDFGRARAARFIEELADLVENRPPKALEAKLEVDDTAAERFDFTRSDYRVLISLREDYLAPLESLKKAMPSISQNRLRLAPMTGTQALAAVLQPGKKLVTEEVAAAIVRFVAGGAELANAEVEPSLLSLICRELNDARLAQGRSEISLDLLAGSHATILSNFYERALADQPAAVRQIIEDDLLTSSGYRENIAEERLVSQFNAVGAAPETLATLVNRRLLRIEERLDVRRVELTHDVLCGVVKASRDLRHEREAEQASERKLAEQRERELAARRALVRARQVASVCIVLAIGAVLAAIFAYYNSQRARRAEQLAEQTRAESEQARGGAEQLLGYLSDDLAKELSSFGQLKVVAEFSKRQIDYFHALPPALRDAETTRNGALAMEHYARAERNLGDSKTALTSATEATELLDRLQQQGDHSEATTVALAMGYGIKSLVQDELNDPAGSASLKHAMETLAPLADAPNPSLAVENAHILLLERSGYQAIGASNNAEAQRLAENAMKIDERLGGKDPANVDLAAEYSELSAWEITALSNLGRNEEAQRIGNYAVTLADKVLELRPGNRVAMHAEQVLISVLAGVAGNDLNAAEALRVANRGDQVSTTLLNLDPKSIASLTNLGEQLLATGDAHATLGQLHAAVPYYSQAFDLLAKTAVNGGGPALLYAYFLGAYTDNESQFGEFEAASATLARFEATRAAIKNESQASVVPTMVDGLAKYGESALALRRDDLEKAQRVAAEGVREVQATKASPGFEQLQKNVTLYSVANILGHAEYRLGHYAAAEAAERIAIEARHNYQDQAVSDRRDIAEKSTWLALALIKQDKIAEAAEVINPVVKFHRELVARNHGDQFEPTELASALYAQALTDKVHRTALLQEATQLIDSVAPETRGQHDVRQMRERIQQALQG
jgi:hypothetical protein